MLVVRGRICLLLRQILEIVFYGFRVRMIEPKSFQESGIGFAQKIARLFQLPQILKHQRQIRLTDGDGGMAGLERLLSGSQRLAQKIARLFQLPQILKHQRQIRLTDGDGGMAGLERLLSGSQRLAQKIARLFQLPQVL